MAAPIMSRQTGIDKIKTFIYQVNRLRGKVPLTLNAAKIHNYRYTRIFNATKCRTRCLSFKSPLHFGSKQLWNISGGTLCPSRTRKYSSFVLGIESSCDDTGAAVVDDKGNIIGEALNSQTRLHVE